MGNGDGDGGRQRRNSEDSNGKPMISIQHDSSANLPKVVQ
jgi:hypothetical protein